NLAAQQHSPAGDRNQFATARGMRIAGLGFTAQRSPFSARLVSTHCSVDSLPSGLRLKMPRKASICLCTSARDSFLGLAMHHSVTAGVKCELIRVLTVLHEIRGWFRVCLPGRRGTEAAACLFSASCS